MASKAPKRNIDESKLSLTKPKTTAVGLPAVANALKISLEQMGPLRSIQTLLAVNKVDGFDCMGCAWPEHEKRNAKPASEHLPSKVAIVCNIAHKLFTGGDNLPLPNTPKAHWLAMRDDYSIIRKHIEAVFSGFENFEERIQNPGGFVLPDPPRDARTFDTASGKAHFTGNELEFIRVPTGRLVLQTLRSHDQYNTTIYGKDDRYRGIHGGRRVVLINADDITEPGFTAGEMVHLISEFQGTERRAENFRIVSYSTPKGCAAAYYPETNVLVPLDSVADTSGTPTSKSVIVRLERAEA